MNIKKVDDKQMVIHTKKRAIDRKKRTLHQVGSLGAMAALDQMEGGSEVRESVMVARTITTPAERVADAGSRSYRRKTFKAKAAKIKKVQTGKKIGKKEIKERAIKDTSKKAAKKVTKETTKVTATTAVTAAGTVVAPGAGTAVGAAAGYMAGVAVDYKDMQSTNRNRKLKFFLDKINAEEQQKDSLAKLIKDLTLSKVSMMAKAVAPIALLGMLFFVLLLALLVLPVVAVIAVIYNSPFAMFFPSISSGDTMQNVLNSYVSAFDGEVLSELTRHSGYDTSEKIYVDFEGAGTPDNYYDILAVYMVKHGSGDTATDMTDKAKENLKAVFDDMCSYSIASRTDMVADEEGNTTSITIKEVRIVLKTYRDMIAEYGFDTRQQGILAELMKPEYLAMTGHTTGGGDPGETLSAEQYQAIVDTVSDANRKKVVEYVLSKVGYPYSQDYRDSGAYYDCSSLAYYAWKRAGVNLMYEGANTAAAEGKYCYDNNYLVNYSEMQPGDLIFYSYGNNGRFYNITHVAVYVGDGKVVEAANETIGVVYRAVQSRSSIVFIGRPR